MQDGVVEPRTLDGSNEGGCSVARLHRWPAASFAAALLWLVLAAARCSGPPPEPLRLDGNMLTVYNSTSQDWNDVQIFLNNYYRAVTPKIAARSQFKAPLDVFVEAYGRRFEFNRMQIRAVRLTATLPGGEPLVLDKPFQLSGVAGALGGKK
jgi:hypothetical protein